jgi:2-polyprenyl-3-methyl-5-hydroxy-6-metoxy-1,4-benzoquinol methylase
LDAAIYRFYKLAVPGGADLTKVELDRHIGAYFNARAKRYDNPLTAFIGERELRQIRPLVPVNSIVLDYGCGTGRTTLDLLKRGCIVTAYDISSEMLAIAQKKVQRVKFAVANQVKFTIDQASLAEHTWPVITCIGVLDYYPDPGPILSILKSYLAPRGYLITTYPNALSPLAWLYALGSRCTVPATPRTPAFVYRKAQEAGLEVTTLRYAFPSLPLIGHTLVLAITTG